MFIKNLFMEFVHSLYDFRFYQHIKKQRKRYSLVYYSMLILLVVLFIGIKNSYFLYNVSETITEDIPVITIKDGIVYSGSTKPYVKTFDHSAFIVDTSGKEGIKEDYKFVILVAKDKLILKKNENEINKFSFVNVEELRIDKQAITQFRTIFLTFFIPIMMIILYISLFIAFGCFIAFFSLLSILLNSILNLKNNFKQMANVGIYALTPMLIYNYILQIIGLRINISVLIYLAFLIPNIIMKK